MDKEMLSLDNLYDIVIPDGPAWWPLAPGAWVLILLGVFLLLVIGYRLYLLWDRNRYRRAGLHLLDDAATEYEVSVILKRVALAAYPREQVASLYGAEWLTFLHQTCPRAGFPEDFGGHQSRKVSRDLIDSAAGWIKHHRSPSADQEGG